MGSFWGIIPRYIIKNKKRILFMGIGIVLSISLIVSLSIMVESLKKSSYKKMIDDAGGNFDISFDTRNHVRLEELKTDKVIKDISIVTFLGLHEVSDIKSAIDISGYDDNITKLLNFQLLEGRYPEGENEIALEKWILDVMPQKYNIGDTIRLSYSIDTFDSKGNKVPKEIESEFVLVGFFDYINNTIKNKNMAKAYVTKEFIARILENKNVAYKGYANINPKYSVQDGLKILASTNAYSDIEFQQNSIKVFTLQGMKTMNFIINILFFIIGIVASVIIYNIFNVTVYERIKEFGMLRAIGASPNRIKALVLGEGIVLGMIFIPIGMILGNLVIKSIIILLSGYKDFSGIFHIPASGVITSLIVGFSTIVLGVYFPAKRAAQVSPMEAISSNSNLKLKGKNIRSKLQCKGILGKTLNFTTNMAYVNLKRNKKRFATTVTSLSITVIMFISVYYLINCSDPINNFKKNFGGDFIISSRNLSPGYGITKKDVDELYNIDGVYEVSKDKILNTTIEIPEDRITSDGMKFLKTKGNRSKKFQEALDKKQYKFSTHIRGYNSSELDKLNKGLLDGKINIEEMRTNPIAVVAQNLNYNNYLDIKIGDKIKVYYPRYDENNNSVGDGIQIFEVAALIKEEMLASVDTMANNQIIISEEVADEVLGVKDFQNAAITLEKGADYAEVEKQITDTMKLSRDLTMKSFDEELENVKKNNMQLSLITYSFVFIVAIVSIINLINIMNMNAILRSKEIGIMRALGLDSKEVKSMITAEGLFYGITAGAIGSILGTLTTYIIYIRGRQVLTKGMTWELPIIPIVVAFITTLAVCLVSSVIPSKSLFKSSIVESIRSIE